ncbi:MAG: amino acid permease [Acidobacteria bacterium]|nr:amino acid permease [Acidobacteriota bacterium]
MPESAQAVSSPVASQLRRELGLWDIVLFNIAAVVAVRWIASAARIGPSALALWLLAVLFFFLPCALTVTELATRFPAEGGYYVWTREAFGEWHGFACGWIAWWSNLVYFPNLALAITGMGVYMAGPRYLWLSENRWFLLAGSLVIFWIPVLTNLVGLRVGKWTENVGGLALGLAGALLVGAGILYWARSASATSFAASQLVPNWSFHELNYWSQIAFALVGIELAPVMSEEMRHPQRDIPRAALLSSFAIAAIFMLGTAALLLILQARDVNVVTGVVQAVQAAGERMNAPWLGPVMAVTTVVGLTGQLGAWVTGAARLPFVIGLDRRLPAAFGRVHPRWRTPHVALLVQGIVSTVLLLMSQIGETARGAYLLLVDMSVIAALVYYVYFFLALIRLRHDPRRGSAPAHVLVPGGQPGVILVGGIGAVVTLLAIALALAPPPDTASVWLFELKSVGGTLLALGVGAVFYFRRRGTAT